MTPTLYLTTKKVHVEGHKAAVRGNHLMILILKSVAVALLKGGVAMVLLLLEEEEGKEENWAGH